MKKLFLFLVAILLFTAEFSQAQNKVTCTNCGGSGQMICYCGGSGGTYTMFGFIPCMNCGGRGRMVCILCGGYGYLVMPDPTSFPTYPSGPIYDTGSSSHNSSNSSNSSSSKSSSNRSETDLCLLCYGDGKCHSCHGSGCRTDNSFGTGVDYSKKCGVCGGNGKCTRCNGAGRH